MSEKSPHTPPKFDPWVASSLLQKAIRRGDATLANQAAAAFARYRGEGIWRRLTTIAVEDVGIADVELVAEVVSLASDRELRFMLGSEADVVGDVCDKLAGAVKDRSADYLYSAATASRVSNSAPISQMLSDAMAGLRRCTNASNRTQLNESAIRGYLASYAPDMPPEVSDIVTQVVRKGGHPFVLMLVPLWSAFSMCRSEPTILTEILPGTELIGGIPAYAWDKHTAMGKQAIRLFARENANVRQALGDWVPDERRAEVTFMATFYADAVPVARRLEWEMSRPLYDAGLEADMLNAGCPKAGIGPVIHSVRAEMQHLNELRRAAMVGEGVLKKR